MALNNPTLVSGIAPIQVNGVSGVPAAGLAEISIVGGGAGTVTSVGLSLPGIFNVSGSPVTTTGTLTGTLADQLANTGFFGPASGADAAPTFRALVTDDLPTNGVTYGKIQQSSGLSIIGRSATTIGNVADITAIGGSQFFKSNSAGNALLFEALSSSDVTTALGYTPGSGTVTSVGISGVDGVDVQSGSPVTGSGSITLGLAAITPDSVNGLTLTSQTSGFDIFGGIIGYTLQVRGNTTLLGGSVSGTNTGDQTITLTGDVTGSGTGSFAATLATVNSNVGTFGSSTSIPTIVTNSKGLITAISGNVVIAPAGTLTGTTLSSNVVTSSLTTVGTIGTGVWQGTKITQAYGGTNADLSATGGTSQFLKQSSAGAAVTVGTIASADISTVAVNSITGTANQVLANATSGSAQVGAVTLTLPQSIGTSNDVLFRRLAIGQNFSLGGATNTHLFHIEDNAGVTDAVASITAYGGGLPSFRCIKTGGSFGSYSATPNNSIMMALEAQGYNGSAFVGPVSRICIRSAELFSVGNNGTLMQFYHTPIGSSTTAVYQRMNSTGLYIGGDVSPTQPLDIYGLFKVNSSGIVVASGGYENTTFKLFDTSNDNTVTFKINENQAANRTLNWVLGASDRTITLSGNPTLSDWFDQAVKVASSPQFSRTGIGVAPINFLDVNGGMAVGSYAGVNTAPSNGLIVSGLSGIGTSSPSTSGLTAGLAVGAAFSVFGSSGLPASGGGYTFMASGFSSPNAGRLYIGDGSGWSYRLAKRTGSSDTDLFFFKDNGYLGVGVSPMNALDVSAAAFGTYAGVNTAPANAIIVSGGIGSKTTSFNSSSIAIQSGNSSSSTCNIAIDGAAGSQKMLFFYSAGSGNWTLGTDASSSVFNLADFGTGLTRFAVDRTTGFVGIGTTTPTVKLTTAETKTLTVALTDGYAGGLALIGEYSGAYTVTRHNYINLPNTSLISSAVLTDAAVMRFDAAAGTHKAIDSGTTKTSPGTVSAWMKVNINGTIHYLPCYTSKTS